MTYFNMKQLRLFFLTFAACLLAACGGLSKDAADETFESDLLEAVDGALGAADGATEAALDSPFLLRSPPRTGTVAMSPATPTARGTPSRGGHIRQAGVGGAT